MEKQNEIIKKIDAALSDAETPRWAVPILLCVRDDHGRLGDHLAEHGRWAAPARQILVSVLTALAVSAATWLVVAKLAA